MISLRTRLQPVPISLRARLQHLLNMFAPSRLLPALAPVRPSRLLPAVALVRPSRLLPALVPVRPRRRTPHSPLCRPPLPLAPLTPRLPLKYGSRLSIRVARTRAR